MAEYDGDGREFERRLPRMFADAGGLFDAADSGAFAARVERRLDRDWTLRRLTVGAAGIVGGGVAVVQLAGAQVFSRLDTASHATAAASAAAVRGADAAAGRLAVLAPALRALPLGAESLWLIAGMAVLAAVLFASRLVDEV